MLGLFRSRLPIDRDEYDWLLAVFAWLVQTVDRDKAYRAGANHPADGRFLSAERS